MLYDFAALKQDLPAGKGAFVDQSTDGAPSGPVDSMTTLSSLLCGCSMSGCLPLLLLLDGIARAARSMDEALPLREVARSRGLSSLPLRPWMGCMIRSRLRRVRLALFERLRMHWTSCMSKPVLFVTTSRGISHTACRAALDFVRGRASAGIASSHAIRSFTTKLHVQQPS